MISFIILYTSLFVIFSFYYSNCIINVAGFFLVCYMHTIHCYVYDINKIFLVQDICRDNILIIKLSTCCS